MLKGKTALVTGSIEGLGHSIAQSLAEAGANIVVNGLCEADQGQAVADRLAKDHSIDAVFDGADLRNLAEIEAMVANAQLRFGSLDVLVNNAVIRHFSPIEALEPAHWDESISVNLSAAFHLVRLALPAMKQSAWGRIFNQASYYGFRGAENRIDYVTTKSALIGMTRAIAIETAATGVTCNAVCPGSVGTPAILRRIEGIAAKDGRAFDDVAREYASARNPMGRFVAPESIGAMIAFLCGPAGDDVSGTTIPIDGGWLAV
jgi:3-hydroxybutyrate dehydrogenase